MAPYIPRVNMITNKMFKNGSRTSDGYQQIYESVRAALIVYEHICVYFELKNESEYQ